MPKTGGRKPPSEKASWGIPLKSRRAGRPAPFGQGSLHAAKCDHARDRWPSSPSGARRALDRKRKGAVGNPVWRGLEPVCRKNKGCDGERLRPSKDVTARAATAILAGIGGGRVIAMLRFVVRVMRLRHFMVMGVVHRYFMFRDQSGTLQRCAHDQKREKASDHAGPSKRPEQCAESHTINFAAGRENKF